MPEHPEAYGMAAAMSRLISEAETLGLLLRGGLPLPFSPAGRPSLAHGTAPAGPLYPPLAQSTPPPSPVQPSPPSDPNPPIATPTSPFDRYPYKPPQHTRFASPGPPLGSTPNDCAVVLRLPNFAWINHRDVDPDTRRERRPARDLGKNLKLHWMSGTEVERRVVEGVHRRVDSLGASQSMRAKARVARFARDAANADAKARGEQRPTKADQDKQAERAGQLGWGNLWLGDHRLRGKVVVLYYDTFAMRILLAQEAKLVAGVEIAESNAMLDGGLALLLPADVRGDYWRSCTSDDVEDDPTSTYQYAAGARHPLSPLAQTVVARRGPMAEYVRARRALLFSELPNYGPGEAPPIAHANRGELGDLGLVFNLAPSGFECCDSILTDGSRMAGVIITGYFDDHDRPVDIFGTVGSGAMGRTHRAPDFRVDKAAYLAHVRECFELEGARLCSAAARGRLWWDGKVVVNDTRSLFADLCRDQTIANLGTHTAAQVLVLARLPVTVPAWMAALDSHTLDRVISGLDLWCDSITGLGTQAQATRSHALAYDSVGDERFKRQELAKADLYRVSRASHERSMTEGMYDPLGRWMPGGIVLREVVGESGAGTGRWVAGARLDPRVARPGRGSAGGAVSLPVWGVTGHGPVSIGGAFTLYPLDTEPGGTKLELDLGLAFPGGDVAARTRVLLAAYQRACFRNTSSGARELADRAYNFSLMVDNTRLVPLRNKTDLGSASFHVHLRYNIIAHVAHGILSPVKSLRAAQIRARVPAVAVKGLAFAADYKLADGGLGAALEAGSARRTEVARSRAAGREVRFTEGAWAGRTLAEAEAARGLLTVVRVGSWRGLGMDDVSTQRPLLVPHPPWRGCRTAHPLRPPLPALLRPDARAFPASSSVLSRDLERDVFIAPWLLCYGTTPALPEHGRQRKLLTAVRAIRPHDSDARRGAKRSRVAEDTERKQRRALTLQPEADPMK